MLALAAILALLIGGSLGLLGGGGSILTLPILVYVLGVEPRAAVAMSLLVAGVTSATGVIGRARQARALPHRPPLRRPSESSPWWISRRISILCPAASGAALTAWRGLGPPARR
jgi:hypothetical protein